MNKREVVKLVLDGKQPPYVPWHCGFTTEPRARLAAQLGTEDIDAVIGNHFVKLGHSTGFVTPLGADRFQDPFGVIWDRSFEKDIGNVENCVLPEPTLSGYEFPDPCDDLYFRDIPPRLAQYGDCFRMYCINPFQPEVLDVAGLIPKYRGRVAFHGGLSTQQTLPQGTPDDVRRETRRLLELGCAGGYIFAPAHAVAADTPLDNMVAFLEEVRDQETPDSSTARGR